MQKHLSAVDFRAGPGVGAGAGSDEGAGEGMYVGVVGTDVGQLTTTAPSHTSVVTPTPVLPWPEARIDEPVESYRYHDRSLA